MTGPPRPPGEFSGDTLLAQAVAARDRKAAAEFVQLYADLVYGFVLNRLTPNVQPVEDLVQEVFLAAFSSLRNYTGSAPLKAWVLAVARHKVEDYYRAKLKLLVPATDEEPLEPADPAPLPDQVLSDAEENRRAAEVLAGLRYEYALLLRWRYWDQIPASAMAERLGKTEKAVERMLARARNEFRVRWLTGKGAAGGR